MTDLSGNGVDQSGSATGTNIARYAGVITASEFSAAVSANTGINHALFISSDIAGALFTGPATKSDGTNIAGGVATPDTGRHPDPAGSVHQCRRDSRHLGRRKR